MKHILILLAMFFFIGCKQETLVENQPSHDGWKLEYFQKVKIQNEELYECVYGSCIGCKRATAFSILSNTKCKERL